MRFLQRTHFCGTRIWKLSQTALAASLLAGWTVAEGAVAVLPASPPGLPAPLPPPGNSVKVKPSAPAIQVENRVYDFGRVKPGEIVRHDFRIKNTGDQVLQITAVRPSCGCTTAGAWSRTVKPNENGIIPIQFNSSRFRGPVHKTIGVTSNDPTHPHIMLELKGTVWLPVDVSAQYVLFPAVGDPGTKTSKSIRVHNQLADPVKVSVASVSDKSFQAALKTVVPGKEFELTVSTVPPLRVGSHHATIKLKTSNPDVPDLSVEAYATVMPPVQVIPSRIILPAAKLRAPTTRYLTVMNRRTANLVVSDVKANLKAIRVSTSTLRPGKMVRIALEFPKGFELPAFKNVELTGKTNQPELPKFVVSITSIRNAAAALK